MRFRSALMTSALVAALGVSAPTALAASGDEAIRSSSSFRLNSFTLEPGCFSWSIDRSWYDDQHIDLTLPKAHELHVTVGTGAWFNVDQVLVPSIGDGYAVYDTFTNTNRPADIGPDQTAVDMFAPGNKPVDENDVIVCVSDHGAAQNEPYQQEAGGLVSAKNRPIVAPKVTALGVSAVGPLHTYKLGFGYQVEKWYSAPAFDGAAFPWFKTVTDPNAVPSPTSGGALPAFVIMAPRPADFPYDARRVNDVDAAGDVWKGGEQEPYQGQVIKFRREGDLTAWTLSGNNETDTLGHLITFTAQGDLPVEWSLRPSLAAPSSLRSESLTDDELRAWEAAWQAYYRGEGAKPTLPLAPGTNSPAPEATVIVNLPEQKAVNGAQAPVTTTTIINQAAAKHCVGKTVTVKFSKRAKMARVKFNGRTIKAKKSGGRLSAVVSMAGLSAEEGSYATLLVREKVGGKWREGVRLYKIC